MGWLKKIAGVAAPIVGSVVGGPLGGSLGGMLGGALGGSGVSSTNQSTGSSTTQAVLDPEMRKMLYGENGSGGLLGQIGGLAQQTQSAGLDNFGNGMDAYLGGWGTENFMRSQQAAQALQGSNLAAPGVAAATVGQAYVKAPSQNDMDLSGSFDSFINGAPGSNPHLLGAIQKGINQSANAFGNMQEDSAQALQDALGSIDGGAIAAGQFGGSRQGLAQGRAVSDFTKQQQRAVSQFGQNNTDAAVSAQAGAYDADRNRALQATMGLSGQQYGVASQNANLWQQTNNANAQHWADAQRLNQASTLTTNALNSNNQQAGIGLSANLLGQANGYANASDAYDRNRLGQIAGTLSPFVNAGAGTTQAGTAPMYTNTTGNILGGVAAGLGLGGESGGAGGLGSMLSGLFGGSKSSMPTFNVSASTAPVNTSALQNMNWWG